MNIVLYSNNCPRCKVLESKLQQKNIVYEEVNDENIMQEKGFDFVPVLEVDGKIYDFKAAVEWIGGQ